jgi:hypothetical protein
MTRRSVALFRMAAVVAAVVSVGTWACVGAPNESPTTPSSTVGSDGLAAKPGGTAAYQLNLSHIECTGGGQVEIHFVLLHVPNGPTPGNLTFSINGVAQAPVTPGQRTGNVWHYTAFVPPGDIDVTSASVSVNATVVGLHNPSAYAGTYNCGPDVCATFSLPPEFTAPLMCLDRPLGSPSAECGFFGLNPQGGDDGGGASQLATENAALAIVKDGSVGCGGGDQAYRFYSPVSVGDTLQQPNFPNGGNISHVTYCACPTP